MKLPLLFLLLVASVAHAQAPDPRRDTGRPLQRLTPGNRATSRAVLFCARGYADRVRSVSQSRKRAVYRRYGLVPRPAGYVVDHLIPLQVGGSNALTNLFPMPLADSYAKDSVEDWAHRRACRVRLPTETRRLQRWFARDWRALYLEMRAP